MRKVWFVLTGMKRIFDGRPLHAQLVDRLPDHLRPLVLPGMRGVAETTLARDRVRFGGQRWRGALREEDCRTESEV